MASRLIWPETAQAIQIHCGVLSGGCGLIADPIEQKRQASDAVDGQFSMPYGAAVALLTGQAGSSVFTERWLQDEAVRTLTQKVECYTTPELDEYYPHEWRAAASVEMDIRQNMIGTSFEAAGFKACTNHILATWLLAFLLRSRPDAVLARHRMSAHANSGDE